MERIKRLALSEEGFVFDPETGNSYVVNQTGMFILTKLKEGKSEEEILRELVDEFEVDEDTARRDITDFLEQLKILGILK